MSPTAPDKTIAIDEEGFVVSGDLRWNDERTGREVLENLAFLDNGALVSSSGGTPVLVEAFDDPLIAQQVEHAEGEWTLLFNYQFIDTFDPATLYVDEWDRFHGLTSKGIPFVFKRSAQAAFFDLVDEFDDDSVTIAGRRYEVPPTYSAQAEISTGKYWTDVYVTEGKPRWDLAEPAEALKDMLPRLKLVKSRVLVLGCGEGHDAALFARDGHIVTAVDFSPEAIRRAKEHYGELSNVRFLVGDVFALDSSHDGQYDVVFEHTLYCAIDPARRDDLVRRWWRFLAPGGHLLAILFASSSRRGPPYGGTEWETRERLKKYFRFLFWGRWKTSIERRRGKELFIYAEKLTRS